MWSWCFFPLRTEYHQLVIRKAGTLAENDRRGVIATLQQLFNLTT